MKYDTKCKSCDNVVEINKKMSEPFPECKKCGGETEVCFTTAPNFELKGKNWATKDCKKKYKVEP